VIGVALYLGSVVALCVADYREARRQARRNQLAIRLASARVVRGPFWRRG
jgi:hypothetical protein